VLYKPNRGRVQSPQVGVPTHLGIARDQARGVFHAVANRQVGEDRIPRDAKRSGGVPARLAGRARLPAFADSIDGAGLGGVDAGRSPVFTSCFQVTAPGPFELSVAVLALIVLVALGAALLLWRRSRPALS